VVSPLIITQVRATDEHDVGIANIFIDYGVTWERLSSEINVTVVNYGGFAEICNLTVYANTTGVNYGTVISMLSNLNLAAGDSRTFATFWDGRYVAYGPHLITAYVVCGSEETNLVNNISVAGPIKVTKPYDCQGDGKVNVLDLIGVSRFLGQNPPYGFNYPIPGRPDTNGDGKVNILDLIPVAWNLGT
jgi:hypothetical protein